MRAERPLWLDPDAEEVMCVRCFDMQDPLAVDRLLWCERCRALARQRAAWWGWVGGLVFGALVASYVWLVIEPTVLVPAWFGVIAATIWMGSKVTREIVYGAMRFRNVHGIEASDRVEAPHHTD